MHREKIDDRKQGGRPFARGKNVERGWRREERQEKVLNCDLNI